MPTTEEMNFFAKKVASKQWPTQWNDMLQATQLIISEIHECINSGGDWTNVQMALMGFALAIKDQTKREMKDGI